MMTLRWRSRAREDNSAARTLIQFQIMANMATVTLTFILAISNSDYHSVLTAVQYLWVNLVMDTLLALVRATDSPTTKVVARLSDPDARLSSS